MTVELSNKSEYALLALLRLADHACTGEPLQIRQIAAEEGIPDRYLEQLLAMLRRAGFIKSQRGAKGGYLLAREPWKIDVLQIVACIEGLDHKSSLTKSKPLSAEGTVIRNIWREARQAADLVLSRYTLQDLIDQRNAKSQLNLMYYI